MYRVTKDVLVEGRKLSAGSELPADMLLQGTVTAMLRSGLLELIIPSAEVAKAKEVGARHARPALASEQIETALQRQSAEFDAFHRSEIERIKAAHAKELQAVQQAHADALAKLDAEHKAALQKAEDAVAAAVKAKPEAKPDNKPKADK